MNKITIKSNLIFFKILILVSFSFLSLIRCTKPNVTNEKDSFLKDSIKNEEKKLDLNVRLNKEIESLEKDLDLSKNVSSMDGITIVLALYKFYSSIIKEGKESDKPEEQELAKKLEKKVISSQIKVLPKLRLIYYKLIKDKLWENDIDVKILNSSNKTLQLTGGIFASNKNIQDTQSMLHEVLSLLRFKQIQYKWYSGDDEFTYYNLDSPKDSEIID